MTTPSSPPAASPTWHDLTLPLTDDMPVYPGDPAVQIAPALTLADDGAAVTRMELGTHTGTHVDAPAHTVPGGRTVDRLTRDELCGPALVLGLPGLAPAEPIRAARLTPLLDAAGTPHDAPLRRVLVATGWDARRHDTVARERHPFLAPDAARLLWHAGARLLGVDALSPDATLRADGAEPAAFPVHARFLGGDGVLVENLAGLDRLRPASSGPSAPGDWWTVVALEIHPLPIAAGDGAPARVWARPVRCDA